MRGSLAVDSIRFALDNTKTTLKMLMQETLKQSNVLYVIHKSEQTT